MLIQVEMVSRRGYFIIVTLLSISALGQSLLAEMHTMSASDLQAVGPGNANVDIELLLKSFSKLLPSRVKLGTLVNDSAYDCFLTGLDRGLTRHGNAVLNVADSKATFYFGLSTYNLTIQCSWRYKFGVIKLNGTVMAYTDKVSARSRLGIYLIPGAHPLLEALKITELGEITTDVTGLGIFNWIGEKVFNRKINGAKDKIIMELEQNLSEKLQSRLNALAVPYKR